jgi:hypothetical protein
MRIGRKTNFKKKEVLVAFLLISVTIFAPLTQSISINNPSTTLPRACSNSGDKDFSITIHRIKQIDEIDPFPHTPPGEWVLRIYVNEVKKTLYCSGEDIIIDKIFTWENCINDQMKYVEIKMELLEDDWPDGDDIADISAYVDENYENGDYDDTDNFNQHRPAVFKRYFNLLTDEWMPVDDDNDFLQVDTQSVFPWYLTTGNDDGSTTVDENDAAVWFNIYVENKPPVPPEKPVGPGIGWVGNFYTFSTRSFDEDGDRIFYAWDWNGDAIVDEITPLYESGQIIESVHGWDAARIFYFRVMAIDEKGMASEWSEPCKIEINGPYGKSGFEVEEWSLGHIYSTYMDHFETQELISTLRSGGNIVTAAATLISAIAIAAGIPLDISVSIAIVTSILRLGVEILNLMDKGMGIYIKAYVVELMGAPMHAFGYAWSQKYDGNAWEPPEDNSAPIDPDTPTGETEMNVGKEYWFTTKTVDPEDDLVAYVFEWGDGTYSCVDYNESGDTVTSNHTWSEKGQYAIRVKAIDIFGFESSWSDPLTVEISKSKVKTLAFTFNNLLNRIFDNFRLLNRIVNMVR